MEEEIFHKFAFKQVEGEPNAALMTVVFEEYINKPFLEKIEEGRSFIAVGESPLLDKTMNTEVEIKEGVIEYKVASQLFRNKIVPVSEVGEDDTALYMELPSGEALRLRNASSKNIGQIMFLLIVVDILDGMQVEVDIEEYIPKCVNCAFEEENIKMYSSAFSTEVKEYLTDRRGCTVGCKSYNLEGMVECKFFVRDTNPDLGDAERVLDNLYHVAQGDEGNGDSEADEYFESI